MWKSQPSSQGRDQLVWAKWHWLPIQMLVWEAGICGWRVKQSKDKKYTAPACSTSYYLCKCLQEMDVLLLFTLLIFFLRPSLTRFPAGSHMPFSVFEDDKLGRSLIFIFLINMVKCQKKMWKELLFWIMMTCTEHLLCSRHICVQPNQTTLTEWKGGYSVFLLRSGVLELEYLGWNPGSATLHNHLIWFLK